MSRAVTTDRDGLSRAFADATKRRSEARVTREQSRHLAARFGAEVATDIAALINALSERQVANNPLLADHIRRLVRPQ